LAVAALSERETQLVALKCLAELGGPLQGNAVAELAKRSPTAEILPLAVRVLTRWSQAESVAPAERRALDQVVCDVQGTTGLLVRWEVSAPLSPAMAAVLVAPAGWSAQPVRPPPEGTGRWQTLFAAGTAARLKVPNGEPSSADSVRLCYTDFTLTAPASLQFLASSNGKLRVWADSKLVHQRSQSGRFQPDSDRFDTDLDKGAHRLILELAPASGAEFHARFRRKSSVLEHERLAQAALSGAGDPEHGRKVFEDVEKSLCLKCHRVGERGERIGPDLSGIGGRFARITIIESILEPSRSITPGFESVTVGLADGRVIGGVPVAETERALTLADQEGRTETIAKQDITARNSQPQSTMPDGLEKRLAPGDFVDVIAYLASLK
jgi:putative heme-binding domain-containing protein